MSITTYLKETKEEFNHVTWLTKKQTFFYTAIVIVISLVLAYLLGFFDFLYSLGLSMLTGKKSKSLVGPIELKQLLSRH